MLLYFEVEDPRSFIPILEIHSSTNASDRAGLCVLHEAHVLVG